MMFVKLLFLSIFCFVAGWIHRGSYDEYQEHQSQTISALDAETGEQTNVILAEKH